MYPDPAYHGVKPCWTVLIALFYGVVINKPDKSSVKAVKNNDQLKRIKRKQKQKGDFHAGK